MWMGHVQAATVMQLQKVDEQIYALVGPFGNRSPENFGNNSTSGFVITNDGVVLIDSGGSYKGAELIAGLIARVTDQPIRLVINSGGQDHRWLGNDYFRQRGARIITSQAALQDQRARTNDQFLRLTKLVGEQGLQGTEAVYADETFRGRLNIEHGGVAFELLEVGPAHTQGDLLVWLPQKRLVFAGDVVFVGRMLGVRDYSNSKSWIEALERLEGLDPQWIIPGHGPLTDLPGALADSRDYLAFLREQVGAFMQEGGDISQVGSLDQTAFSYLHSYDLLKGGNAQQVFQEMEWE